MDNTDIEPFDVQPQREINLKKRRSNKKNNKIRKAFSGMTKKDRMDMKKWESEIVKLNRKINDRIKKRKSCQKEPLNVTFKRMNKMRLTKNKRSKGRKAKVDDVNSAASNMEPNLPVESPSSTETSDMEPNPPVESPSSTETSDMEPKTPVESPSSEKPSSIISSVTEGVQSAAESVGLASKPEGEETKKEGGRRRSRNGKKGKKGKWV